MFTAIGSSLTSILVSVKWEGLIKIINAYTHTQRKNQEELERVHERNFENSKSQFPPR